MLFDISDLGPAGVRIDECVPVAPFRWSGGDELKVEPVRLRGRMMPTARGVEFEGRFETGVRLGCGRCLAQTEQRVAGEFLLFLVRKAAQEDVQTEEDAAVDEGSIDLFPVEEEHVDLESLLREQIELALPARVLCSEDCRGLCPRCGVDLNREACSCEPAREKAPGGLVSLRRIWEQRQGGKGSPGGD